MVTQVILIGGGGHASVVLDALMKQDNVNIVGYVDDVQDVRSHSRLIRKHLSYLGTLTNVLNSSIVTSEIRFFCCIGDNSTRQSIVEKIQEWFAKKSTIALPDSIWMPALIHPNAVVANGVQIGRGTFVAAGAIVCANAFIENHCILNTNCSIDHDCSVASFVHIAPG